SVSEPLQDIHVPKAFAPLMGQALSFVVDIVSPTILKLIPGPPLPSFLPSSGKIFYALIFSAMNC
ncbi:MAG: hypothetical protein ABW049_04420, partial [Spongiibacteraceae bacterium]